MKYPIYVRENDSGDVTAYPTIEEAAAAMEPVDVKDGLYSVADADGQALTVIVETRKTRVLGCFWLKSEKTVISSGP